jgi:DNA-binding response OmpR family regulator
VSRVLLLFSHRENARLLGEALEATGHRVLDVVPEAVPRALKQPFDLCVADVAALQDTGEALRARKTEAHPVLLPVLLVGPNRDAGMIGHYLGHTADEWLGTPIHKAELQVRVDTLLRLRELTRAAAARARLEGVLLAARTFEHELNNALVATLGYTERLSRDRALPPAQRERAARAHEGAKGAAQIIRHVLELTEGGRLAETNWGEVGETTIDVGNTTSAA